MQRGKVHFLPNEVAHLLGDQVAIDSQESRGLKPWLDLFISEELGFKTKMPEAYPKLSLKWETPERINNAILELDQMNSEIFSSAIKELNDLNCRFLELRYYHESDFEVLLQNIELLRKGTLRGITIYVNYPKNEELTPIIQLANCTNQIQQIIVHSTPSGSLEKWDHRKLHFTEQRIQSNAHCGQISTGYFAINIPTFTEGQCHNNCLNKKIAIGTDGTIKNCPSMQSSYGKIGKNTLADTLENPDFLKLWSISKDQIEKCKDCEFRYVCTDCRAFIKNPENLYSEPLKCGYDPNTNEWEDWSKNPLKQKAIAHYELKDVL